VRSSGGRIGGSKRTGELGHPKKEGEVGRYAESETKFHKEGKKLEGPVAGGSTSQPAAEGLGSGGPLEKGHRQDPFKHAEAEA